MREGKFRLSLGLGELRSEGLIEVNGTRGRFTQAGAEELEVVIEAVRASQR